MKQEAGDGSNNVQVNGNVTVGISYNDARQIALDVFKANIYEFTEKAAQVAAERANSFNDALINKLFKDIPQLTQKLEEPSVQSSMFNAQREFAKTGDFDLENRLLDLLVERINSEERSLKQIALDEALLVLPKLTNEQINILTFLLSAVDLSHESVSSLSAFSNFINDKLLIFYPESNFGRSFFAHLQGTGCCIVHPEGSTYKPLEEIYRNRFKGLFSKGFSKIDFQERVDYNIQGYNSIIINCLRNDYQMQYNAINDGVLESTLAHLSPETLNKIKALGDERTMSIDEIKNDMTLINPKAKRMLEDWKNSALKTIKLTSVGYAIAVLNYNKRINENLNLEAFI